MPKRYERNYRLSGLTPYLRRRERRDQIEHLLRSATLSELWAEFVASVQRRDWLRAECITDVILSRKIDASAERKQ